LFSQFSKTIQGLTCDWTIIEMFRAFKKQVNLGVIDTKDAQVALDFFLVDITEQSKKTTLILTPVTMAAIIAARKQIFSNNLYAADALHATVAINSQVKGFITLDKDFKANLDSIPVLNPKKESFKTTFKQIIHTG